MTILAALLTAALALTLRATFRLIAQRDAERRRGDLALAGWKSDTHMHKAREAMLLDDLDFACSEAVALRERVETLQREALPVLQPWSGPPSLRVVADVEPLIFRSLDGAS